MQLAEMKNDTFYFLDKNAYNVNDPEARVVEMDIIVKNNKSYGHAQQGPYTLEFEISATIFEADDQSDRPLFFATREAAEAEYERHVASQVVGVRDMPKEEIITQFFRQWAHDSIQPSAVYTEMVEKLKAEFGVDVTRD